MLIEIQDKVVSVDLFEKKFVCDLAACKGACCIEGDSGAPLTFEEVSIIEDALEQIKPYMRDNTSKKQVEFGIPKEAQIPCINPSVNNIRAISLNGERYEVFAEL